MLQRVCSCVTLPSQVHRRQTPSTSSSSSGRASLVSSVKTRHISWSSLEEHDMSPEHLAAAPDDEGNVFDDDDQDTSEVGEQAEDAPEGEHPVETPAAPEVAELPPQTPAVAEPDLPSNFRWARTTWPRLTGALHTISVLFFDVISNYICICWGLFVIHYVIFLSRTVRGART